MAAAALSSHPEGDPPAVEPLRPLSPGSLSAAQTRAVLDVLTRLLEQLDRHDKPALMASVPGWIERFSAEFDGSDGYIALQNEIRRWIYWTRVPGYWLGYVLQEYAKECFLPGRPMASLLYAHAQECVGDADAAQSTVELAYHDALLNQLPETVVAPVVERLRFYHWFYSRWSQPGTLFGANPLLEHPYHYRSWGSLRTAFPTLPRWPGQATVEQLENVVEACQGVGMHYYLPVARRWLATSLSDARRAEDAAEELRKGLEEAYISPADWPVAVRHDAEIGHLHRLRGETLGALGSFAEAEEEHELGLAHEDDRAHCSYWQALSAKKLGHARWVRCIIGATRDDALFADALEAYRVGRDALDLHLMITESPVARAAAQQLVRTMSEGIIAPAVDYGRAGEAVAEIESLGPRAAADALAELMAASRAGDKSEMQQLRAGFHRHLTTVPEDFEEYLAAIPAERELRRAYRATRTRPDVVALVSAMLSSSIAAERVLKMRVPDASIALFHVGELQGRIVVLDLADDPAPTWINVEVNERDLRNLHATFRAELEEAGDTPGPAVERFLESARGLLGGPLAALAARVRGRHVKLFPRAQLSLLPLHALDVGKGRLIDNCDVSYGQSLGLLTPRPAGAGAASSNGLMVLVDSVETRYLAGSAASLSASYGGTVVQDPTLDEALAAAERAEVRDLVFACHGVYLPDDPAASYLEIGGRLSLARLFESSALPNCRSVTMASCVSGLARAEIASESVGLSGVFLSAGARTVIATLWKVHELPTVLLLDRHFSYIQEGLSPARALNAAQRELASMPLKHAQSLVERVLPNDAEQLTDTLKLLGDPPFAAPEYWAAFTATGEF